MLSTPVPTAKVAPPLTATGTEVGDQVPLSSVNEIVLPATTSVPAAVRVIVGPMMVSAAGKFSTANAVGVPEIVKFAAEAVKAAKPKAEATAAFRITLVFTIDLPIINWLCKRPATQLGRSSFERQIEYSKRL